MVETTTQQATPLSKQDGFAPIAPVQAPPTVITPEAAKELADLANKTGLRYNDLEARYNLAYANIKNITDPGMKRSYALMTVKATCITYMDNPLLPYEIFVIGTSLNEGKTNVSKIICGTKLQNDVPETMNGVNFGIPTIITNFEQYNIVEKTKPFTFWKANLSRSAAGAERRDISSTQHTEYAEFNRPDITREQIRAYLDKNYPIQTLASLKTNLSKKLQPREAGKEPFVDALDFKRVVVTLKRANSGESKKGNKFYLYTVVDDSLTEAEQKDEKNAAGYETLIYGGVSMSVPRHIYNELSLDMGSVVEALVTVRQPKPGDGNIQRLKVNIALDAIAIFPIVELKKKIPEKQQVVPNRTLQAFDLTAQ